MEDPIIFHDPTSEPSRAVHWFCLEGNIPHEVQYVWLTRNDHMAESFLAVNPMHQVPALKHGDFCLSEATAIMQYLADVNECSEPWFGNSIQEKAVINKLLSWYHTNLRKVLTLDYFLPALLLPVYLGIPKPDESEIAGKKEALLGMLGNLESLLEGKSFLSGAKLSAADLLFAAEIEALRIDPEYEGMLEKFSNIASWLSKLQALPSYKESHKAWLHVASMVKAESGSQHEGPEWVAVACEQAIS